MTREQLLFWAIWLPFVPWAFALSWIDLASHRLPTRIIAPAYGWVMALICLGWMIDRDTDMVLRSIAGWLIMGGAYLLLWRINPGGLGYGDVRLAGVLGLALGHLGVGALITGLYGGFLLGGIWALILMVRDGRAAARRHFAFGPFMLAGALIGAFAGPWLA